MTSYIITEITHDDRRIKPIVVNKKPTSHTGHLKSGTIWKANRYNGKRVLVRRFSNNELVLLI